MPEKSSTAIAVIGIDIGKASFHVVGIDEWDAIILRQKWSRGQVDARLANCTHRRCRRARPVLPDLRTL